MLANPNSAAFALVWALVQQIKLISQQINPHNPNRSTKRFAVLHTDKLEDLVFEKKGVVVSVPRTMSASFLLQAVVHVVGCKEQRQRHLSLYSAMLCLTRPSEEDDCDRPALPIELVRQIVKLAWGNNPLVEEFPRVHRSETSWLSFPKPLANARPGPRAGARRPRVLRLYVPPKLNDPACHHGATSSSFETLMGQIGLFESYGAALFGGRCKALPSSHQTVAIPKRVGDVFPPLRPYKRARKDRCFLQIERFKTPPIEVAERQFFKFDSIARNCLLRRTDAPKIVITLMDRWSAHPAMLRVGFRMTLREVFAYLDQFGVTYRFAAIIENSQCIRTLSLDMPVCYALPSMYSRGFSLVTSAFSMSHSCPMYPMLRAFDIYGVGITLLWTGVYYGPQSNDIESIKALQNTWTHFYCGRKGASFVYSCHS